MNSKENVVICFQISIFEPLNTAAAVCKERFGMLWFAFKLVSLNHWIQPALFLLACDSVVICFQISIFEPLNTACCCCWVSKELLWFAFKLVSLNHWIQRLSEYSLSVMVVICFQISIFEPLNTAISSTYILPNLLWFAFKLVSLNHWIQHHYGQSVLAQVVICFQISIFEPLNTAHN